MPLKIYLLRKILAFLILLACIIQGCNNYKFITRSAYLNDNSLYFNDGVELSIQLPGDFILYNHKNKNGIRLKHLYRNDKKILQILGLNGNNSQILFAGTPVVPPYYNLICVLQNQTDNMDVSTVYKRKINNIDIGIGTIPFYHKLIELIYYSNIDTACAYCDIDSITAFNKRRISAQLKSGSKYNQLNNCVFPSNTKIYNYQISTALKLKTNKFILEAYNISPADSSKILYSYRLIDRQADGYVKFELCPGNYLFKLRNFENKTLNSIDVSIPGSELNKTN